MVAASTKLRQISELEFQKMEVSLRRGCCDCNLHIGSCRDYIIYFQSIGPGSTVIIESLRITECFDLPRMEKNSTDAILVLVESMKLDWADRLGIDADPGFTGVPSRRLLSKGYASKRAREIK